MSKIIRTIKKIKNLNSIFVPMSGLYASLEGDFKDYR